MNIKIVLLSIFFLFKFFFLQAQNAVDTVLTIHEHTTFFDYDSDTRLMVINNEFNPNTNSWNVAIDIYGYGSKKDYENDDDFNGLKKDIHFESPYKKQIEKGTWQKGDSVKNGYWIQYEYGRHITKVCEGFVVNGLRENTWIEYKNSKKIGEGNYIHGKKDGVWKEWQYTSNTSGKQYIAAEQIGTYKNGLKQGEWIEYVYSKETGEKSSVGRKILYLNDTLTGNYKKTYLKRYNKATADCESYNLLRENLICISLRAGKDRDQLLLLLDSLHLNLYSDKVLRTYTDQNGKTKILTVREHNQYVLSGQWWTTIRGREGPVVFKKTLIVEKMQGVLKGNNDKILKQLGESKIIQKWNVKILCTYTLDADPLLETIYAWNLSSDDEAIIKNKMKLSPSNSSDSEGRNRYASYDIQNLSLKETEKLLKLLSQSRSVTKISCAQGYIINH